MPLFELSLACGERLRVHRFSVRETVSSLFDVRVVARSPDPSIDLKTIVGQPAALRVASGYRFARGGERLWSGLCHRATLVEAVARGTGKGDLSTYEIEIAPLLWLLTLRSNYRAFQHLSLPDIVRAMLEGWPIAASFHLHSDEHPRLAYKVQYDETDFHFMSRILEEAGIAYVFEDDGERSRLVLSDALHNTGPRREATLDHVLNPTQGTEQEFATRVSIAAYMRPSAEVRTLKAKRACGRLVSFETNAIGLRPGVLFCIENHPMAALNPRAGGLLVTSMSMDGGPDGDWTMHVKAVPAVEPYRPPLRTAKPRIGGVQYAVVVGPPGQEIHTDGLGRVRVQFPWDREGQFNERSSPWLRVCQGWAEPAFGRVALPRVGQEVLVAFQDGDPDQPIVIGSLSDGLTRSRSSSGTS